MTEHATEILAVRTYGTQPKIHNGKRLSTLKIGYSGIIPKILLALLSNAIDVSSQRDRYIYMHIPNKPKLRHNWLFISLKPSEVEQVESLTMTQESSWGIVLWRDSKWLLPPSQSQVAYHAPRDSSDTPTGSPSGFWSIRTDGSKGSTGGGDRDTIIAEYSKLDANKSAWWWIAGNDATYKNLSDLKRYGCRWKRNRRAFAYIGDTLPEGLLELLDNAEECRAIMNGMNPDEAKRIYRYRGSTGEGGIEEGKISTHTTNQDAVVIEYEIIDIDNAPGSLKEAGVGLGMTSLPSNVPLSDHHQGQTAWTTPKLPEEIEGRTEPETLEIVTEKCVCEDFEGAIGWLPAENVGTWVACGSCNPHGKNMPQHDSTNPDTEKSPVIRIVKPLSLNKSDPEDAIANAICQTANLTSPPARVKTTAIQLKAKPLSMVCVGELTGSIMANVFCYGYALDGEEMIFLNMGGPRSGVEAIRAKLGQGQIVNLSQWDAPGIELTAGEGNTGVYRAYLTNMQEARFVHCMLVHERFTEPSYAGKSKTYILQMSEDQAKGQLLHHVRETVKLPVFTDWIDYLWEAGQTAKLIRNIRTGGGLIIKAIDLDVDSWGRLIQYGVAEKVIAIPQVT